MMENRKGDEARFKIIPKGKFGPPGVRVAYVDEYGVAVISVECWAKDAEWICAALNAHDKRDRAEAKT